MVTFREGVSFQSLRVVPWQRALDRVGRAQVSPMLGREVVERQEDVAALVTQSSAFWYFAP